MTYVRAIGIVGSAVLSVLALVSVRSGFADSAQPASDAEPPAVVSTFAVEGMTCGGCAAAVEHRVGRLDGVRTVDASYEEGTAVVTYYRAKASPDAIVEAIESLGYEAELVDAGEEQGR
ncbi:MAG: heavy-metal-associated domain-containing protein [Thermoanaerobaculia bacterium]